MTSPYNMSANTNDASPQEEDSNRIKTRVRQELMDAGAPLLGTKLNAETKYLYKLIHPHEHIRAAVFGYGKDGFAMLAATDRHMIYLDKKPGYANSDEVTYDVVSGITYGRIGPLATITLHTRVGDYALRWVSPKSAQKFLRFIEDHCLEYGSFYTQNTLQV